MMLILEKVAYVWRQISFVELNPRIRPIYPPVSARLDHHRHLYTGRSITVALIPGGIDQEPCFLGTVTLESKGKGSSRTIHVQFLS